MTQLKMVKICRGITKLEGKGGLQVDGVPNTSLKQYLEETDFSLYKSHQLVSNF